MSNHKFKLSNIIPNSWFYKLRVKSKTRVSNSSKKTPTSSFTNLSQKPPHLFHSKQPYYYSWESPKSKTHTKSLTSPINFSLSDFDDHFPDLPKISISRRKTIYKPSPTSHQFCYDHQSSLDLDFLSRSPPPEFESEEDYSGDDDSPDLFKGIDSISSSCSCGCNSSTADIITDHVKETALSKSMEKFDAFDTIQHHHPTLTNPTKSNHIPHENASIFSISPQLQEIEYLASLSIEKAVIVELATAGTQKGRTANKRAAVTCSSPFSGIKLRTNPPRISIKKIQGQQQQQQKQKRRRACYRRKKRVKKDGVVFESLAVVMESDDPERDFRESMMEMIVENNIRASKDLEHLLACYLTLNSNEYHQLIMKAFEQIWFNLPHFNS